MAQKQNKKKKHVFLYIVMAIALLIGLQAAICTRHKSTNPHSGIYLTGKMRKTLDSIKRVDDDGALYYMEVEENYNAPLIKAPVKFLGTGLNFGCSAFITSSDNGDVLTGRNFDVPHMDEDGNITGLNLAVHSKPKNGYETIGFADAAFLSMIKKGYDKGSLDDGETDLSLLFLTPYLCMDIMNEKGLTVSILFLDIKDGETAVYQDESGKEQVILNMLMRYIADNCADVDEAVEYAKQYNAVNTFGCDYHLFITDRNGKSAVLEWRYNDLYVTYTDAVTNFYVGFDDAEDCYQNGQLKDKFVKPDVDDDDHHYGYGHGYGRFAYIIENIDDAKDEKSTASILENVAQEYTGELTSYTQYSIVYNNTDLTATAYVQSNFDSPYEFSIHGME